MFRMQVPSVQAWGPDSHTWRHPELAHPVQPRRRVERTDAQRVSQLRAQLPRRRTLRVLIRTTTAAALATPRQKIPALM